MERTIKLLVIDVDGTMTDAGVYYDEKGNEIKKFSTRDAVGFYAAHNVGMKIMVLTGRECAATTRRMKEMEVDYLFQNIKSKGQFLMEFMREHNITRKELGYIGDDLNDYSSMAVAGFVGCPADSCSEILRIANYISTVNGGYGAVRDVVEHILRESGEWEGAISEI